MLQDRSCLEIFFCQFICMTAQAIVQSAIEVKCIETRKVTEMLGILDDHGSYGRGIEKANFIFMLKTGRKIFAAYESGGALPEISELENLFEARMASEEQAEVSAVDFAQFWTEQSWRNAVGMANSADLIVVSLSGDAELPMPVQRWMETWTYNQHVNQKALAVVFTAKDPQCPKRAALVARFQQIAELHGLEFICNHTGAPEPTDVRRIDPMRFIRESVLAYCGRLWAPTRPFQTALTRMVASTQAFRNSINKHSAARS